MLHENLKMWDEFHLDGLKSEVKTQSVISEAYIAKLT